MKLKVHIEDVKQGDVIKGKKVVEVLHRFNGYVRLILEGGWPIVDGYMGEKMVEIER